MHDLVERYPLGGLEISARVEPDGDQRRLGDVVIRDSEHLRDLALVPEMKRGPRCGEASVAGGEHEAPGRWKNRTVDARDLHVGCPRSVDATLDAWNHHRGH